MSDLVWAIVCAVAALFFFGCAIWIDEARQGRLPRQPIIGGALGRRMHARLIDRDVATARRTFASFGLFFLFGTVLFLAG